MCGGTAKIQSAQCRLLRETVGNPFRQLRIEPSWLTGSGQISAEYFERTHANSFKQRLKIQMRSAYAVENTSRLEAPARLFQWAGTHRGLPPDPPVLGPTSLDGLDRPNKRRITRILSSCPAYSRVTTGFRRACWYR